MVSSVSDEIAWLKYLTIYTFINVEKILTDTAYTLPASLILLSIAAVLFVAAIRVFNRKSLAL